MITPIKNQITHNMPKPLRKMDWDSDFFGFPIAQITSKRLTPAIEKQVLKLAQAQKIKLIEFLCPSHDKPSIMTAERNHYHLADIRVTMEQTIEHVPLEQLPAGFSVRMAGEKDLVSFKKLAGRVIFPSRYYTDKNFNRARVSDFYATWVAKAIMGQFDHAAYGLFQGHKAIGFCTIKKLPKKSARIGLFGMDSRYEGRGLATLLLKHVLVEMAKAGTKQIQVVTQARNYQSQRVFQKCGFLTKSVELWYHKWL